MWEPFSEPARRAIVRAQEVAQMFASSYIGTEHIAFALAETDDPLGHLLATAIDREELRELLGGARGFPKPEMVFTPGAKRTIELAFQNARRLGHSYIGSPHLALGILGSDDGIPLKPGADVSALRAELDAIASGELAPSSSAWEQTAGGDDPHSVTRAFLATLRYFPDLGPAGTEVTVTIAAPNAAPRTWSWKIVEGPMP